MRTLCKYITFNITYYITFKRDFTKQIELTKEGPDTRCNIAGNG